MLCVKCKLVMSADFHGGQQHYLNYCACCCIVYKYLMFQLRARL